jgi:hypothetical protein
MKKMILFLAALLFVSVSVHAGESIPLDWSQSKVTWVGKKVLGQHSGTVKIKELNLQSIAKDGENTPIIAPDRPAIVVIDLTTIADDDLKDADSNAKLVGHLKSEDFFDVAKFPVATLIVTGITPRSQKSDGFTHDLKGSLTIKNITHDVVIPATVTQSKNLWKASGKFNVDRTQYDIRYRSGKFFEGLGDKIIKDEFEVGFDIVVALKS